MTLADHRENDRAEKAGVNLNAGETQRCNACQRAGGPDGLGPSPAGVIGEVRRTPEGWVAVCFTDVGDRRWHFVGDSPRGSYGWAPDRFMGNAETIAVIPGTTAAQAHTELTNTPRRPPAVESVVDKLERLAIELDLSAEDLDELVHDVASRNASDTNNAGIRDQLAQLLSSLGEREVSDQLHALAKTTVP
ncbi:hypothetical protein [Nocardia sp. NPDC050710]|uniref:hypothetical protein n=1 Tax=Nocardia sp. NPDC050710 TaxID=3157220 RepID=UPI0033DC515E